MEKPLPIKKYTKIINIATGLLIAVNLFTYISSYKNIDKNFKLLDSFVSKTEDNIKLQEYDTKYPNEKDYFLALVDIFKTKLNFIYIDTNNSLNKSGLEQYIGSHKDSIFVNSQLTEESKSKYQNFVKLSSQPISKDVVEHAREVLKKGEIMYQTINQQKELSPSFKKVFINNLNELSHLVNSDESISIINIYRKNIDNQEFQKLLEKQDTATLWNQYLKEKFGKNISPVAYLQDGTYQEKEGSK